MPPIPTQSKNPRLTAHTKFELPAYDQDTPISLVNIWFAVDFMLKVNFF